MTCALPSKVTALHLYSDPLRNPRQCRPPSWSHVSPAVESDQYRPPSVSHASSAVAVNFHVHSDTWRTLRHCQASKRCQSHKTIHATRMLPC